MDGSPLDDEAVGSRWQVAVGNCEGVDFCGCFELCVFGVEMRWWVMLKCIWITMPKKRVRASPASGRFANRPYVASPYAPRRGRATSRVAHTVFRCRGDDVVTS